MLISKGDEMNLSRRSFLGASAAGVAASFADTGCLAGEAPPVRIDADFPGGNIRV